MVDFDRLRSTESLIGERDKLILKYTESEIPTHQDNQGPDWGKSLTLIEMGERITQLDALIAARKELGFKATQIKSKRPGGELDPF